MRDSSASASGSDRTTLVGSCWFLNQPIRLPCWFGGRVPVQYGGGFQRSTNATDG